MGAPGRYEPALFDTIEGGDNEILWFDRTLSRAGVRDRLDYAGIRVCLGDPLPAVSPESNENSLPDAVVIGGSFHCVHDGHDWQHDLVAWLKALRALGPSGPAVFGICGGHQLMAQALGAPVEKLAGGELSATLPVTLTDAGRDHPLFADMASPPCFHFGNEDHVAAPPAGAAILGRTPELPAAALDYGGRWYSVQFHPESTAQDFAQGWRFSHPEYMANYVEVPQAPLIFRNFLRIEGVVR
jgi:GMP synthase (glutamine-hydrolysing)